MRTALYICLLTLVSLAPAIRASAQRVSYDPPANLPQQIAEPDYKHIVDSSLAIIRTHFKIESVQAGSIHVLDKHKQPATINLDNLILQCLNEPDRAAWNAIIHNHFEKLFSSMDQQRSLDPTNYETMKKYLSIRIYPKETVGQRGGIDSLVARVDMDGTYTLVMIDFPGAFTPVSRSMFDHWKKDASEVFAVAQAHVDSQNVAKITKSYDIQGIPVEITALGDDNYAASYALDLDHNSPELVGEWGCALAMPSKALVLTCKITREKPLDFVKFIQLTQPVVEDAYQKHPQPISDQYFWYYKGKFTLIATKVDENGHLKVLAPPGLAELMSSKP